jgi:hypothetical protein
MEKKLNVIISFYIYLNTFLVIYPRENPPSFDLQNEQCTHWNLCYNIVFVLFLKVEVKLIHSPNKIFP